MGALKRALVGACAVLAIGASSAHAAVLAVQTSFEPASAHFGDRVLARVVVTVDERAVDLGSVRIAADLGPLAQLGEPRTTQETRGEAGTVTYEIPAACLGEACIAGGPVTALRLPRARVEARLRTGGVMRRTAAWPALSVRGRVTAADLQAAKPRFRRDVTPPAVTYRVAPLTLARTLVAVALLLALAGLAVAAWQIRALVLRRRARDTRSELEHAVDFVRDALLRPPPDRRRALGLLARVLRRRDGPLSAAADELAWSEPEPAPERMAELAERAAAP
jgi:hypothetical protein